MAIGFPIAICIFGLALIVLLDSGNRLPELLFHLFPYRP